MTKGLTKIEKELAHHESIIEDGVKSFLHVGRSLIAIRDGSLYGEKYGTFEAYCEKRWGFKKSRAYQFISAAEIVAEVSTIVDNGTKDSKQNTQIPVPKNEAQARALADAGDTPEERREVWTKAVETAPRNEAGEPVITARHIAKVADEVVGPKVAEPKANPKPEPVQESVAAETDQPEYGEGFNPREFDPELNPDLQRVSVARLPIEEKLVEQPKMIEAFCRAVRKHFEDNIPTDPLLDEGTLNIVGQQLTSMLNTLRQRKAYGRCPKCPDKINPKCGFCKGHGYVTKTTFESAGGIK